jgi:uncharacterized membrane protein YgaE (UPF0421/DUF939 family)
MIKKIRNPIVAGENPLSVTHVGRTVLAAVLSLLVAPLIRLPEAYWAGITTLAVIQSTSEAALPVAVQYFAGTAVGAAVGGWAGAHFPGNPFVFGACALTIGFACVPFRLERTTFRYASITLAVVMLVRSHSGWIVAVHRFLGVSLGIAVGLAVCAMWPERTAQ